MTIWWGVGGRFSLDNYLNIAAILFMWWVHVVTCESSAVGGMWVAQPQPQLAAILLRR